MQHIFPLIVASCRVYFVASRLKLISFHILIRISTANVTQAKIYGVETTKYIRATIIATVVYTVIMKVAIIKQNMQM